MEDNQEIWTNRIAEFGKKTNHLPTKAIIAQIPQKAETESILKKGTLAVYSRMNSITDKKRKEN